MKTLLLFLFLSINVFGQSKMDKAIAKELHLTLDLDLCKVAKDYAKDTLTRVIYFKENTEFQHYACFEVVYDSILSAKQIIELTKKENLFFNSYALQETLIGINNTETRTIFIFRFYNE